MWVLCIHECAQGITDKHYSWASVRVVHTSFFRIRCQSCSIILIWRCCGMNLPESLCVICFCTVFPLISLSPPAAPPRPPHVSRVWVGSPFSRWIHCKTERESQTELKKNKRGRQKQTVINKLVFVSTSLWFCVGPCVISKGLGYICQGRSTEPRSLTPPKCEYSVVLVEQSGSSSRVWFQPGGNKRRERHSCRKKV